MSLTHTTEGRPRTLGRRLRKLATGVVTAALALGAVVAGGTAPAMAAATGSTSIFSMGETTQQSGSDFSYQINVQCSGVGAGEQCEDASVFIPFTQGLQPNWGHSVLAGSAQFPVHGAHVTENGVQGYRITFQTPLPAGTSTSVRYTVRPPSGITPNNTTWEVNPVLTFTSDGESITETAPEPAEGTATATFQPYFTKGFATAPNNSYTTSTTVAPGSTLYMRFYAYVVSGNGTLRADSSTDWVITDPLPEGLEYNAALTAPAIAARITYDEATRTITYRHPISELSASQSTLEVKGIALTTPATAPTGGTHITNTAEASARGIGEPANQTRTSTARATVIDFVPTGSLFSKTTSSNLQAFSLPAISGATQVGMESTTSAPFTWYLRANRDASTTYDVRLTDYLPCYSTPITTGYGSPATAACAAGESIVTVKRLTVSDAASLAPQHDVKLFLRDGSTHVLTVDTGVVTAVPAGLDVIGFELEAPVYSRSEPGVSSSTSLSLAVAVSMPDDARLVPGTIIRNTGQFAVRTGTAPFAPMSNYFASVTPAFDALTAVQGASDSTRLLNASGNLAPGQSALSIKSNAWPRLLPGSVLLDDAMTVYLLPPTSTGISLNETSIASAINSRVNTYGGSWELVDNWNSTGRPALVLRGGATLSTNSVQLTMPLVLSGATSGSYEYEVFTGVLGRDMESCDYRATQSESNGTRPWQTTLSAWPTDDTICGITGKINLVGPTNAFKIEKQVRESAGDTWQDPSGSPLITSTGAGQYRLSLSNVGPDSQQDIVMYDVLPAQGDVGSVAGQTTTSRGSTVRAYLTSPVTAPAGFTVSYSTSANPCMSEINLSQSGCSLGVITWSTTAPADLSTVRALRIASDPGTTIPSGESVQIVVDAALPASATSTDVAWNTVSATTFLANGAQLLPTESPRVGLALPLIDVTPTAPYVQYAEECGVESVVVVPDTTGVRYVKTQDGQNVEVVAEPLAGYAIAPGAQHRWSFNLPPVEPCSQEVTPAQPTFVPADTCGVEASITVPETTGVTYTQTREGRTVTVQATANEGYHFAENAPTHWTFVIPDVVPCAEEVTPAAPTFVPAESCGVEGTVTIPDTEGVSYETRRDGRWITVIATADNGFVLAEGARDQWQFEIPAIVPCPTGVAPAAPTLAPAEQCGVEGTVVIPDTEGVTYSQTREGNTVTVTATANDGYVIAEGARSTWEITIPDVEPCPEEVTPVAPTLVPAEQCGVEGTVSIPEVTGVVYTASTTGRVVTVTATAADGYVLAEGSESSWEIELPEIVPCPEVVTPLAPELLAADECGVEGTVTIPSVEGVIYVEARDGNTVTITATAAEGYVLAEGSETEWVIEIPEVVPCPTVVETVVAPVLVPAEQCGVEATVELPVLEGVVYDQVREGNVVTVTATAAEGYVLAEGVETTWEIEIPEIIPCDEPVTPIEPIVIPSEQCGMPGTLVLPEVEGVVYTATEPDSSGYLTVTAEAADGYVIADGAPIAWEVQLGMSAPCDPVDPEDPAQPQPEEPTVIGTDVKKGAVTGDPLDAGGIALLAGLGTLGALLLGAGALFLARRRSLAAAKLTRADSAGEIDSE